MTRRRWLLPDVPDVIGLLSAQASVTADGMQALLDWARGDGAAAERVRMLEHTGDDRKRELRDALTELFAPPFDPEDLFTLSQGVDEVLNGAKDTVREAELMGTPPDGAIAEMAAELLVGTRHLADAFAGLGEHGDADVATAAADLAIKSHRNVEHVYRRAMSALIGVEDLHEVTAKRELYRRFVRVGGDLGSVAERIWYAVLKQT